ncbi:MAG TPA: hypothetical protein DG753_05070 [Clostridium sp.]|nr:hypothetical protein [Clostridium sp.]
MITTTIDFFDNKYELESLELWSKLNDKYYNDLSDEIKRVIKRRYLSAIILLNYFYIYFKGWT